LPLGIGVTGKNSLQQDRLTNSLPPLTSCRQTAVLPAVKSGFVPTWIPVLKQLFT
jgi:hypothetical protein